MLKKIIINRCFKHDLCYKKHLVMLNAFFVNANLRQCVSMMQNKNWVSSGEAQLKKMHSINKIISKHSVKFYLEPWKHRNKVKHDP